MITLDTSLEAADARVGAEESAEDGAIRQLCEGVQEGAAPQHSTADSLVLEGAHPGASSLSGTGYAGAGTTPQHSSTAAQREGVQEGAVARHSAVALHSSTAAQQHGAVGSREGAGESLCTAAAPAGVVTAESAEINFASEFGLPVILREASDPAAKYPGPDNHNA